MGGLLAPEENPTGALGIFNGPDVEPEGSMTEDGSLGGSKNGNVFVSPYGVSRELRRPHEGEEKKTGRLFTELDSGR